MTNQVEETIIEAKDQPTLLGRLNDNIRNNLWIRLLGEAASALFFVFSINLIIALGEDGIPFFDFFYNFNIGAGIWIGFMTLIAFIWSTKTPLSANVLNLVLASRRGELAKDEFWLSIVFQFIGGLAGALMVYLVAGVVVDADMNKLHSMGGALPKLKGFINTNVTDVNAGINIWHSFNFVEHYSSDGINPHPLYIYLYAALQGTINATWIIIAFYLNGMVDRKNINNRAKQLGLRYIILVIGISLTTIFYANTTNWIRLLTPNIINMIMGGDHSVLIFSTTLIFICVQTCALLFMYFKLTKKREE